MQLVALRRALCGSFFVLATVLLAAGPSQAASPLKPKVIYNFKSANDGNGPVGALVIGPDGAFYGVTKFGGKGSCQCGTVFKLTPPGPSQSAWRYQIIYSFAGGIDGEQPNGNLVFDADGDLYGTTTFGGSGDPGHGVVFRLKAINAAKTIWSEHVIYRFKGGNDGEQPDSGLVIGKDSALYGVTPTGGKGLCTHPSFCGTLYQLKATSADKTHWTKTRLHDFDITTDGMHPSGRLVVDKNGALYGTTQDGGGESVGGTVFKLAPPLPAHNAWRFAVLAKFTAQDGVAANGVWPIGGMNFGPDGALYGTTSNQGDPVSSSACGTVFRLAIVARTLTTIARFSGGNDGCAPNSAPFVDPSKKVYGASQGGITNSVATGGALYQLFGPARPNGLWRERTYTFPSSPIGAGELIADDGGTLYGVTRWGGVHGMGTVFMIQP